MAFPGEESRPPWASLTGDSEHRRQVVGFKFKMIGTTPTPVNAMENRRGLVYPVNRRSFWALSTHHCPLRPTQNNESTQLLRGDIVATVRLFSSAGPSVDGGDSVAYWRALVH